MSKLKCDPYEHVSLDERLEKLENSSSPMAQMEDRVDQINNTLVDLLKNPIFFCPTDNNNYKLINNVCYYFESQKMTYNKAQLNCRLKVGQFGGHLFEPYTKVQYCQGLSENFKTNTTAASRYIYFFTDQLTLSQPGGHIIPTQYYVPPRFSDLATALLLIMWSVKSIT